jgi:hypothetical protein
MPDHDLATLWAALGFLQSPPRPTQAPAPASVARHDTWTGVGLIAVGVEWQASCSRKPTAKEDGGRSS